MREDDCNILVNLSREDYREFRSLVIDMVLATDMSCHFQQIKSAKNLLSFPDPRLYCLYLISTHTYTIYVISSTWFDSVILFVCNCSVVKSKILSLVLHCCDVAHPSKPWPVHRRWTDLLLEEFFLQGDMEKELGLPYSPLCDRNNTLVAESQIGPHFSILFTEDSLLYHRIK